MSARAENRVAVYCVGNYYLRDDGFAIHLFHRLKEATFPLTVELHQFGTLGLSLIDHIEPYRKLFILDAMTNMGRPGDIFRLDLLDNPDLFCKSVISGHDFGVMEVLEIVRRLYPEKLPREVVLWGVEAEVLDEYGTTLSPKVAQALVEVEENVLNEIELSRG
jgi:hydrogenase maturation protease